MTTAYSNSQLQTYKDCPLQYRFYWDLKLRHRELESSEHHLRYGDAIHKALEQLYRGAPLAKVKEAFVNAYPTQLDPNDKAKTQANGLIALANYIKRWREEDKQWKVVAIETRSDDPWSVKPDVILQHVDHGGLFLMDHKTTGQYLNYRYWERFEPNSQITHYLDYARSKYGPIEGFIINAISFRYRERAYKGEPAGFWCNFERQVFNRNDAQLDFERQSRAAWIADIERSRDAGFWRTNTNSCWRCPYRTLCAGGWTWEDDRELVEIQYRQVCDALLDNDDHCTLDLGHDGECEYRLIQLDSALEIEVEV